MEQRWNEIDRGKPKNKEKNLSQCHNKPPLQLEESIDVL
jgi:hypothetical protein